jgi:glutamate N-acetyltransferase/amino-acid N-acetyltransferase
MERIAAGISAAAGALNADAHALHRAAHGILTTDTREKIASRGVSIQQRDYTLTGIAKGAGMIGPHMATLLAVLMTDANLSPDVAQQLLQPVVDDTFNCISVEGHMSTNDTVLLLASGAGGGPPLAAGDADRLQAALRDVCTDLARAIPSDGEGASHLITIEVEGCASAGDARRLARAVADSPLVKTAVAGNDPNWGRIVSAAGSAGVPFDPTDLTLALNDTLLYCDGTPAAFDAAAVAQSMRDQHEVRMHLRLVAGTAGCRFWTSDLTCEYVRINAEYHT